MNPTQKRQTLDQLLAERGLVAPEALEAALTEQRRSGEFLGTILTRMGLVSEDALVPVLAEHLGLPYARLRETTVESQALAKVPVKVASRYNLLPLALEDNRLQVAITDPSDVQALDELKLLLGCEIRPVLAGQREIQEAIQRHYGLGASAVEQLLDREAPHEPTSVKAIEDIGIVADGASVISFVNQLILQAVEDRATDVHIEPYESYMRIRERIDGVLYEIPIPDKLLRLHQAVISRIKVMANLDIAEKRLPQDGRIKVRLPEPKEGEREAMARPGELDLRISVLPMSSGEGVVIRLLSAQMLYALDQLGLAGDHLRQLSDLLQRPHGIIFVTGPTGSGKTTTLYSCLAKLNASHRKILTIEDPIEYQIQGINQIQVHPKIGLSFANGLRSMLRHDPDIMMVGEVRDPETAEITIRSALTGHLVFSTLHTNDAAGGVTRLLDMGIEPFLVTSSVNCFIAQRLVRVVCSSCREMVAPDPELREEMGVSELPKQIAQGGGCQACKGTGYKGRTAIYEFLHVNEEIQRLMLRRASSNEIRAAAVKAGMRGLREDGWDKIVQGQTTPEEVLRVC